MIDRRQALPWLISSAFHALILLASLLIGFAGNPVPPPQQPIEVALEDGGGVSSGEAVSGDRPPPAGASIPIPPRAKARIPRPGPPSIGRAGRPRLDPIRAGDRSAAAGPVDVPSPQDVLSDLPSASEAAPSETTFGWEGGARRTVIARRDPRFPEVLSAAGLEVECVARITVAPEGNVTRVEIMRSSGYTEIDASVEAALREFLFSRVEGRKDAVGTITFRFRLEKRD